MKDLSKYPNSVITGAVEYFCRAYSQDVTEVSQAFEELALKNDLDIAHKLTIVFDMLDSAENIVESFENPDRFPIVKSSQKFFKIRYKCLEQFEARGLRSVELKYGNKSMVVITRKDAIDFENQNTDQNATSFYQPNVLYVKSSSKDVEEKSRVIDEIIKNKIDEDSVRVIKTGAEFN